LEIASPCVGVCRIDAKTNLCRGCARTADEITAWAQASDQTRRRVWAELPVRRARLGMKMHRMPWTLPDVHSFVVGTLRNGGGVWVSGSYGASAEFSIGTTDEAKLDVTGTAVTAATSKGAITFRLSAAVRALAFARPTDTAGSKIIVLAVPREAVTARADAGLNRVGCDAEAIAGESRSETLYDFGLQRVSARFGIRTARHDLIEKLDGLQGQQWPALLASVGSEILRVSPTRVVRNAIGRIEVFTPIPPPTGLSPSGPHTHFLPHQLAVGGDLPPTMQIPDSYVPCAIHYPAPPSKPLSVGGNR
jgi:predicted Fe-S protein YdhL (DUF1289 family)